MNIKAVARGGTSDRVVPLLILVALALLPGCREASSTDVEPARVSADGSVASLKADTAAGRKIHRFVAKEDFANTWFWDFDPVTGEDIFGGVWIARGGTGRNQSTWLSYWVERCRTMEIDEWWFWECEILADGWGTIPNADLTGSARGGGLTLDTNTTGNPNFHGAEGRISLRWEKSGWFSSTTSGTHRSQFGRISSMSSGTSHNSEARSSGTILDIVLPAGSWGWMGTTNQLYLTLDRPTGR